MIKAGATAGDAVARQQLLKECGVDAAGADQLLAYVAGGMQILGDVPTQDCIIAERFFDEAGGMQLVLHAPFGGRLNRAWGLALRKRFCLNFDFELQAAATDDGIVLSLGEQHSFPLDTIFQFLQPKTVREVLIQATLATPLFLTRWRWNVSRSLAMLRFQNGKRVPVHLQRMRAEDLLAAAFPMAAACGDNHVGDIPVPDHPLVQETIRDCLFEAMDLQGLREVLERIDSYNIELRAVESPVPSPFAHEILNVNPYAFLDDAPLEERRARAVNLRRTLPSSFDGKTGTLDIGAIEAVCEEAWPTVRDSDELFDVLQVMGWVPAQEGHAWREELEVLVAKGRVLVVQVQAEAAGNVSVIEGWTTRDHLTAIQALFAEVNVLAGTSEAHALDSEEASTRETAAQYIVQGWMPHIGPVTAKKLANRLGMTTSYVSQALLQLEAQGQVLRGHFRPVLNKNPSPLRGLALKRGQGQDESSDDGFGSLSNPLHLGGEGRVRGDASVSLDDEWCDRSLLARIHRRTVTALRREIEPVAASDFMRFLFRWQHCAPGSQLHAEAGLREVLSQLAGYEAPASAWESSLLKSRVAKYKPEWLDNLCLRGEVAWGRLTPPERKPNLRPVAEGETFRRITPTSMAPISFMCREDRAWMLQMARPGKASRPFDVRLRLSGIAQALYECFESRGACFFVDLTNRTGHLAAEVEQGLWELVAAGLVTADGFDPLRALLDPRRRRADGKDRTRRARHSVGRWALLEEPVEEQEEVRSASHPHELWAKQLAHRYGVVFRDILKRESLPVTWRELLIQYRKMEWRGDMRGGRFVDGFTGEQFARPEAVEVLRAVRRDTQADAQEIRLSPADPLNLVGIILPGERIASHTSQPILFRGGVHVVDSSQVISLA